MLTVLFKGLIEVIPLELTSILSIALFGVFIITPTYFIVNLLYFSVIGLIACTLYTLVYYMLDSYIKL